MMIKPYGRGRGCSMYIWLCVSFFFMGRESSELLLWKYLGLAQLLQTTIPFTKANSGNVLKTCSSHVLHHFPMGLNYSCHYLKCRTYPHLLELMGVLVFHPLLVMWCGILSIGSFCCIWEMMHHLGWPRCYCGLTDCAQGCPILGD